MTIPSLWLSCGPAARHCRIRTVGGQRAAKTPFLVIASRRERGRTCGSVAARCKYVVHELADELGWPTTYDAEYLALTPLQADAQAPWCCFPVP
jgi:hypothetical protein